MRFRTLSVQPPEGACPTHRALYNGLEEFERDLRQHVHLENNIVFPRALEMGAQRERLCPLLDPMPDSSPLPAPQAEAIEREVRFQRLLMVYIVVRLMFMLLPGTFLGFGT